nr:hypothetical protein [Clostridioides sp.]
MENIELLAQIKLWSYIIPLIMLGIAIVFYLLCGCLIYILSKYNRWKEKRLKK